MTDVLLLRRKPLVRVASVGSLASQKKRKAICSSKKVSESASTMARS